MLNKTKLITVTMLEDCATLFNYRIKISCHAIIYNLFKSGIKISFYPVRNYFRQFQNSNFLSLAELNMADTKTYLQSHCTTKRLHIQQQNSLKIFLLKGDSNSEI